jgi:hypothetical protein
MPSPDLFISARDLLIEANGGADGLFLAGIAAGGSEEVVG